MKPFKTAIAATLAATLSAVIYLSFHPGGRSREGAQALSQSPAQASAKGLKTLSIVHFNDLHAHYDPVDYGGKSFSPLALIRGFFDQVKAENPSSLFCSAGDDMEKGSVVDLISKGESTIEIYRHLGLDYRAVGNHDFAYGLETLRRFVTEPGGVVLCANQEVAQGYHQTVIDGIRVGVFSMVCRPWDERDEQYDGPYFTGVAHRYDYVALATEIIRAHRGDVDLLFMLSHLGLNADEEIASQVPGLDFIIGGHSHTVLQVPRVSPNGTVIVQAGSFGTYVGRLDVFVNPSSRKMAGHRYALTLVDPGNMAPNTFLETKVKEICEKHAPGVGVPVAVLPARLSHADVARLACQAAIAQLGVDGAVIDLKTVWEGLPAGPITRQSLLDAFRVEIQPPGTHGFNSIMTVTVNQKEWELIRKSASKSLSILSRPEVSDLKTVRVAMQRRTALRSRDYFSRLPTLGASARFEMEAWELLAKHLAAGVSPQ